MNEIVEIDGSYGSGGGQIIRTALGLSALTGKACIIRNIRAKRCNPGLQEQHLQAVNSLAKLCDAKVKGNFLRSREIEFFPSACKEKSLDIKISTAGSVALVLQALLIPTIQLNFFARIEGGATYGKWAPPIDYTRNVIKFFLKKAGFDFDIEITRHGFYPKGGALVKIKTKKVKKTKEIIAVEKTKILSIEGISLASSFLSKARVAERQEREAKKIIYKFFNILPKIKTEYVDSLCPGSGIVLWLKTENSIIGTDALGEKGKKSEQVGKEAAEKLISEYERGVVDRHAADQLVPYLALVSGKIAASEITEHAKTNIFVAEKFLPVKFFLDEGKKIIGCKKV